MVSENSKLKKLKKVTFCTPNCKAKLSLWLNRTLHVCTPSVHANKRSFASRQTTGTDIISTLQWLQWKPHLRFSWRTMDLNSKVRKNWNWGNLTLTLLTCNHWSRTLNEKTWNWRALNGNSIVVIVLWINTGNKIGSHWVGRETFYDSCPQGPCLMLNFSFWGLASAYNADKYCKLSFTFWKILFQHVAPFL
jgi:hypothetical protein